MAKQQSRNLNRPIIAVVVLAVLFSYAAPNLMGLKSPRLTPKDALSPLQLKEREARLLREEIDALNKRLDLLVARNKLAEKAQELALEKSQEAQSALDAAQADARSANEAFDEADLKDKEAKQALRYARMTERQALEALKVANEKERAAQRALLEAETLQTEANKALINAQSQSRLASQTLSEIEALEAKIAELNAIEQQEEMPLAKKPEDKAEKTTRRLPKAGEAILAFEGGLVPQHNIKTLPKDLDTLEVAERKETFIALLLPLIVEANEIIAQRRKDIISAIDTNDEAFIKRMVKLYGLSKFNGDAQELHSRLLSRVAPVPTSLALAQAAVESGWGQSRFAKEGNALFGQWAWTADAGIKPLDASNDRAVIRSFATIYDSVFAYMHNLNTHSAYAEFRQARAEMLAKGEAPSGLLLSRYLTAYAELGKEYVYTLQAMILHNRFDLYEPYRLAR